MGIFILITAMIVIPATMLIRFICRTCNRKKLMSTPIPQEWIQIIKENIALYNYLPRQLKEELHGHTQIILKEKHFEGCGGLELTEEMKIIIAAQAAILLLNKKPTYFPKVDSILVYPTAYVAKNLKREGFIETKERSVRLGESWIRGVVVLAWDHVRQKTLDLEGGHNVVLHEFAHQLDQESGGSTGTPRLETNSSYGAWGRIMSEEYEKLKNKTLHHISDVMDSYGTKNPAEFFAVATETFFEKAKEMKDKHPKLYEELKDYYKLDPASWTVDKLETRN